MQAVNVLVKVCAKQLSKCQNKSSNNYNLSKKFDTCLECQVAKQNFLKRHMCKKMLYLFCCGFWWNVARVFSTSCLWSAAERKLITALACSDKLEVGGWWVYSVRQFICQYWQSQASYQCDRQMNWFSGLLSYSTVVLYIGIMKVWGFWPEIITPKPAWYLLSGTLGVLVRLSQTQKCLQINPKPFN